MWITFYAFKNTEPSSFIDVFTAIEAAAWSDENLPEEDKHSARERPCYC